MIERLVGEMEEVVLQPSGRPPELQPLVHPRPAERARLFPEEPQDQSGIPSAMPYPLAEEVGPPGDGESGECRCAVFQRLPDLGLKSGRNPLIRVEPENPLVCRMPERELFRLRDPSPGCDEHLIGKPARELRGPVGTLGVDDHDIVRPPSTLETLGDVPLFIAGNDDDGERKRTLRHGAFPFMGSSGSPPASAILRQRSATPTVNQRSTAISWSPKFHSNRPFT